MKTKKSKTIKICAIFLVLIGLAFPTIGIILGKHSDENKTMNAQIKQFNVGETSEDVDIYNNITSDKKSLIKISKGEEFYYLSRKEHNDEEGNI